MKKIAVFIDKNLMMIISLIGFLLLILTNPFLHMFCNDELHAFVISKLFNHFEIIKLMRAEGHTFLWYYIIKLIPNLHSHPPYLLKVLSVTFSFLGILILWLKAPFSKFEKFLITFTYPLLFIYPVLARPYSLSIMCIFILADLYKSRLKHPIWYSIVIFITALTNLMGTIGAFSFGLILIHDLIKIKHKNLHHVFGIAFLCIFSLFIQWHNPILPEYTMNKNFANYFFCEYSIPHLNTISYFIILPCIISAYAYFWKDKRTLFFFTNNFILLIILFNNIYHGNEYHYFFLYIYLIVAYWIRFDKNTQQTTYKIFLIFFILTCLILQTPFKQHRLYDNWYLEYSSYYNVVQQLKNAVPKGSIIHTSIYKTNILGLFKDEMNFEFRDYSNTDLFNFKNFLNIYVFDKQFSLEKIKQYSNNNKKRYVLIHYNDIKKKPELFEFVKNNKNKDSVKIIKSYNGLAFLYEIK